MSCRKSRPLNKKLIPSLTWCIISIFNWLYFCTGFRRFCKGVHFFKVAVYFLIVRRWLTQSVQDDQSPRCSKLNRRRMDFVWDLESSLKKINTPIMRNWMCKTGVTFMVFEKIHCQFLLIFLWVLVKLVATFILQEKYLRSISFTWSILFTTFRRVYVGIEVIYVFYSHNNTLMLFFYWVDIFAALFRSTKYQKRKCLSPFFFLKISWDWRNMFTYP